MVCLCYLPHGKLRAAMSGTRNGINMELCVKQRTDKDKIEIWRRFNSEYFDSEKLRG
jgi:hypothetical protein